MVVDKVIVKFKGKVIVRQYQKKWEIWNKNLQALWQILVHIQHKHSL
jgi:uncharacterized protein YukE